MLRAVRKIRLESEGNQSRQQRLKAKREVVRSAEAGRVDVVNVVCSALNTTASASEERVPDTSCLSVVGGLLPSVTVGQERRQSRAR